MGAPRYREGREAGPRRVEDRVVPARGGAVRNPAKKA